MSSPQALPLGKQPYKHDDRTLKMADFFRAAAPPHPSKFDLDKDRLQHTFKPHMWGNDVYGDCVVAGEANALLRMEFVESKREIAVKDTQAVARYKKMTGCVEPGDENDVGLVVLDAMKDWRTAGFKVGIKNYKIEAFGVIELGDLDNLRAACYLLDGIHFGLNLPLSAHREFVNGTGWRSTTDRPGTWGGHLVYAPKYDENGFYVWTWETLFYMDNAFIKKYADEQWAVVDALDSQKSRLNVEELRQYLSQVSHHVQ